MPTNQVLDQLRTERDQARDAAIALAESDDFDPTAESFMALEARSASLDTQISRLVELHSARESADALLGRMSRSTQRSEQRSEQGAPESWGETFIRSEVFSTYPGRGTSSRLHLPGDPQTRALPTALTDLIAGGWKGGTTQVDTTAPPVPTPLLNSMQTVTVSQNSVDAVAWAKVAGGADVVPEGAAKPSAEWAPVVTPTTLDNVAVYTELTRQLIEDAPAVRSLIDGELRREVLIKEEQLAAAALVAANLPTADGAGDLLAGIRVGMATVQAAGYTPRTALINPADWAALDIAILGGTLVGPTVYSSYWGLSLIASPAQPAGTVTVGDMQAGVQHYVRQGVSLYVTDSHLGRFVENIFTLLAERRAKTLVTRPAALCEVTAGTAPAARTGSPQQQSTKR
jgi:hypothetical protein